MRFLALSALFLAGCGVDRDNGSAKSDDDRFAQLPACEEGDFLDAALDTDTGPCQGTLNAFAGAAGSTVGLGIAGHDGDALVSIESVSGEIFGIHLVASGEEVSFTFPWTGEFLLRVDVDAPSALALTRTCTDECTLSYTRYPIFLMHGMAGTDTFLGQVDYFNEVADALTLEGYEVHAQAVDPFQISDLRAVQWASHLDALFAEGRHRGVNLVGHSQGGMDARYVASFLDPEARIASVLTIGTPHHGTRLADVAIGLFEHSSITTRLVETAISGLANVYGVESEEAIIDQIQGMAPDTMADFNELVTDRDDVYYASWGGKSCQLLDVPCLWSNDGEIITPAMAASHLVLGFLEGDNDGLVSVASARWGVDYGALSADHADQIGLLNLFGFDHVGFYLEEADYLAQLGF